MRSPDRTDEYVGGSGRSAIISATVAPERRWRMSITCLSLRESGAGVLSGLFGISVAAIGLPVGRGLQQVSAGCWKINWAEFSTVAGVGCIWGGYGRCWRVR